MTLLTKWEGEHQPAGDLTKKFSNTYSFLAIGKEKPAAYLWLTIGGNCTLVHCETRENLIAAQGGIDIIQSNVPVGVYDLGANSIAVVRRLPERQWAEGLCAANTLVLKNGDTPIREYGYDLVHRLFSPQKDIPYADGVKMIKANQAIRLTHRYWLRQQKDQTSLFRLRARVGSWAAGRFYWANNAKILREELKDEMNFHG